MSFRGFRELLKNYNKSVRMTSNTNIVRESQQLCSSDSNICLDHHHIFSCNMQQQKFSCLISLQPTSQVGLEALIRQNNPSKKNKKNISWPPVSDFGQKKSAHNHNLNFNQWLALQRKNRPAPKLKKPSRAIHAQTILIVCSQSFLILIVCAQTILTVCTLKQRKERWREGGRGGLIRLERELKGRWLS